ncbi:MAG: HAD family phosphatase [Cytophagales bacterium]|nr:HAD family phosphatase [Cytophagales bacterium]
MDGVIIDSEPTHQKLEFEMFDELGLHFSEEEHKTFVGTSSIDMWTRIKENHSLSKTPQELLMYGRAKYWQALDQNCVPLVNGSKELMTLLHQNGFIVQVASSATRPTVDKVIAHFSLEHLISHRIGGDEVKKSKPDPEIFIKAAGQSGTLPSRCLVIEDSANGIKAAKDAGMLCIGYKNPGTGNQDLSSADLVVMNLKEISVEKINDLGAQ